MTNNHYCVWCNHLTNHPTHECLKAPTASKLGHEEYRVQKIEGEIGRLKGIINELKKRVKEL